MNKKEILLICLIFCFIFSMQAVASADIDLDNTNDTKLATSSIDAIGISNDLSSYSLPENNQILRGENDDAGSFSDLQSKINSESGTIVLDRNYTFNESLNSDIALATSGIVVEKDSTITIVGAAGKNITINGLGDSKLFSFKSNVILQNINFINGVGHKTSAITSDDDVTLEISNCTFLDNTGKLGGAIQANGGLTLTDSIFDGNLALDGGSIYIGNSQLTSRIENCNFTDSKATTGNGGCIYSDSSDLTLYNINITDSAAAVNGGAIVINGENTVLENIYIADCRATNGGAMYDIKAPRESINLTFVRNHAFSDGGAVYLAADSTNHGMSSGLVNSTFRNNIANDEGGALYLEGRNDVIFNCTFESNTGSTDAGAIMIKGSNWRVYNSTFKNNKVNNRYGGAIYLENSTGSEIWYSNFTSNEASYSGGAIFLYNSSSTTIAYSNFTSNTAGHGGGAIYWNFNADDGTLTHSRFISNTAHAGDGGGVYWNGNRGNITWCTFEYNSAEGSVGANTGYGGGLSISGIYTNASNCTFRYNHADVNAGGCVVKGTANSASTYVTVRDSIFEYNDAGRNAGGLCWNGNSPHGTAINCTFRYNHALGSAGALGWQSSWGEVYNSTFEHNYATGQFGSEHPGHGGAMTFRGSNNLAYNCTFYNNTAAKDGGAAYMRLAGNNINDNTTFELCKFINNTASNNGGVLAWEEGSGHGYVYNCNFTNNTAKRSGGAIAWYGTYGLIEYSDFTNNTATGAVTDAIGGGDAGSILWVGNHGLVNHCNFTNNFAEYRGGSTFIKGSTNITFNDTIFKFNTAGTNGGGIDWQEGSHDGKLLNSVFINNTAWRSAGAVFWYGTNGTIYNCNFTNNTAVGNVTSDDRKAAAITYSTVGGNGGALVWTGSIGNVTKVNFDNNYAERLGGAVFLELNENVTLKRVNFTNNTAGINGGAVDWYKGAANGRLEHAIFINNTAKRSGGAIYWYGHNGTLYNVSFTDNKALGQVYYINPFGENTTGGDGGAIFWTGYDGNVTISKFINNTAAKRGGAVFLLGASDYYCNNTRFMTAWFENNTAGTNGGAVDWFRGATHGSIDNATFINNVANRSGGAIYWNGDYGDILNSNFTNNRAKGLTYAINSYGENTTGGSGGAIIWSGSHGEVINCRFIDNNASRHGGAVYMQGTSEENCTNTTFDLCYFEGNNATINGGALDWHEGAHDGVINRSEFVNNMARANGGAIFWSGHGGDILHSNFTENYALGIVSDDNGNQGDGGAIIWSGLNGYVEDCWFKFNNASARGGAVYLQACAHGNNNTTFVKSHFINNTAGTNGGAIDWHAGAENGTIKESEFINNTAKRSGGAIYWNGHYGTIQSSNFTYNRALGVANATDAFGNITYGGDGGAVIWIGSDGTVDDCRFEFNNATKRGGAVYLQGTSESNCTDTNFTNSHFINNTAGTNGGAIDWNVGAHNGLISGSEFVNNTAKRSGGAVYWNGQYGTIKDTNFTNNTALGIANATNAFGEVTYGGDGGAVIWIGSHGTVDNCWFKFNEAKANSTTGATGRGGAVYLQGTSEANCTDTNFTNSHFINNTAGTNGGAIDWNVGAHNGLVSGSEFINNTAVGDGGAIFWNGITGTIKNTNFTNNTVGDDGGAIYWDGDGGIIDNIICIQNKGISATKEDGVSTSSTRGGTICLTGSDVSISNSTFSYGQAYIDEGKDSSKVDGGAIFITGNNVNITSSDFDHCNATNNGGTLYILGNNTNIYHCTFDNSTAKFGGVIYVEGIETTIVNATATNSNCTKDGGVLYVKGDDCEIYNSTLKHNVAGDDGGAIYWDGDNGKMYNITCEDNKGISAGTSHSKGGAICLTGDNASIEKSSFDDSFSTYSGGTIFITGNNVNITDSEFKDSKVDLTATIDYAEGDYPYGGALYVLGNYTNVLNCTFDNCTAINGGVMYVEGHDVKINATFTNSNSTKDGGALYVVGESCELFNSTFKHNVAGDDGGAIYWDGNDGSMYNITCEDNKGISSGTSASKGGTICLTGNNTSVNKSSFKDSFSTYNGGAIFVTGNNVNITESDFKNCSVDITASLTTKDEPYGGALYILGNYTNVLDCTFEQSKAINGAIIYVEGHDATIRANCSDASATKFGGAIFIDGENATITESAVENTNATLSGGAIYVNGFNATIEDSSFDKTNAFGSTGNGGGAIFIEGDLALVKRSNFTNNAANSNTHAIGGAIYVDGENVNISDSIFEKSKSNLHGGAIYIHGTNTTISGSNFTDCTVDSAGSTGGAIYVDGINATIKGSDFDDCSAKVDGGAIYVEGVNATINESEFDNCIAESHGGAIYIHGTNTTISGSNFTKSKTTATGSQGGAIYVDGLNAFINGSDFDECSAVESGGSIYIKGTNTTIQDSNFTKSKVTASGSDGGAIYVDGNYALINGSNFVSSQASHLGGAIYIIGSFANIIESNINLSKSTYGAGIYIEGNNATIDNSTFNENKASAGGGGIYSNGIGSKVYNSNFTDNEANKNEVIGHGGGAIYWVGGAKGDTIENCTFTDNAAGFGGGIRWVNKDGVVASGLLKNCTFDDNWGSKGSAISWASSNSALITECTFINNYAYKNGGIYAGSNGQGANGVGFNITYCNFINNSADFCGGDIACAMAYAVIKGCNFTGSEAGYGGSIVLRESSPYGTKIIDCIFTNTTSAMLKGHNDGGKNGGGAIYVSNENHNANSISLINVTIINSTSTTDGGAIRWGDGNNGKDGSLINVTIINSTATSTYNNQFSSYGKGGAIYWLGNNGKFQNVTVINANSRNNGGAVYVSGTGLNIVDSNFISSVANNSGGAIYWNGESGVVTNSNFTNNSAINNGGGIYWASTNGQVLNSLFTSNNATNGGGIYWAGSNGKLDGTTFVKNNATLGGGVYWTTSSSTFTNNKLYNNTATNGGGVYWNLNGGSIVNTTMMYNKATTGSAIYAGYSPSDIINTTLLENQAHSYEIYNTRTTVIDRTANTITVFTYFRGNDNQLNAIYKQSGTIYYTNVTYLGVNGVRNTNDKGQRVSAVVLNANQYPTDENEIYQTNLEVYQDVTVYAYDGNNKLVMNVTGKTDYRGAVEFTYTDDSFPADDINVKVFHPEDNYYTYIAFANRTKLSTVIIEVDDIYFQETEYINITVRPFNETETVSVCPGNVTVYINGELYAANVTLTQDGTNGHATVPVSGLHVDTYRVYVAYSGNGEYIPEYNSTTFRVLKIPSWVTVEVDDYYYGDTGKAIIHTIENASANVTVIINGREYHVEVNDTGYAELPIPLFDAGNYTAEAYYPDTRDCYASNATDDFNILKVNSTLNITGVILDSLNTIKLYIDVGPADTFGKISILFDGKQYNLTLVNSTAELTLYDVELGVYPVYAEYYGDRNHYGSNNTTVIDATKYRSYIDIDVTNITYGENETIIFNLPSDATGNLTITFNGQTFNETIKDGKVILENLKLPAGNYTVNATYLGDDYYRGSYSEELFIVAKAVPILEPIVENITYMEIEHIIANINQTGNVSIIIRSLINPEVIITQNLTINITNGRNVSWNVSGLARGDYFAQVIFHGNQNYTSVEVNSTFIVKPAVPIIIVEANNTDVDRYNPINITVYPRGNVTGNVTVYFNGENIGTYDLTNGFIRLENVYILNNGTYDIVAVYNGDNNFTHQHNSTTFIAGGVFIKHDPLFNITALNVTVAQNGQITINLPANATGMVYIKVNDTQYYVNLSETRTLELPLLGNGTYDVWANYTGDDYWNSIVNSTTFKVSKLNTTVDINVVEPITYDAPANITVTVLNDVDGFITLTINNGTADIRNITLPVGHGKVNWIVDGLGAGSYTVYANYTGSARYNINDTESKAFTVTQATPSFTVEEVTVDVNTNATVTVKVANATGKLNITVDGKNYTADIINGEAVFTIDKLANGTYDVKVTYAGNDNYTYKSDNFEDKLLVNKVSCYPINVTAIDVDVGENTTITVRVPTDATGSVTIWVNGTEKINATIKDGVATFRLNQTIAGRYDINATLTDVKYTDRTAYASYWVSKVDTPISIDVDPIYVGDKAIITVTVPEGVANNVSIEIDGVKQNKTVNANVAVFEVQIWSNGTRTVVATYDGDNKYAFNSTTANFTVSKRQSELNVTATGRSVGDNATIKVEVPDNATGYVTVNVNGTDYTINLTGGVGSINITGLGNGTYYVHATYLGDRQYNVSTNFTETFEMTKVDSTVTVTVENVTYGNHTVIVVNVPGATGNITIKINDTDKGEFTLVNGKVEFDAGILAADNYTVHVTYKGDGKYSTNNADKDFNVSKAAPVITIESVEVNADTNATVVVYITPGTTGRINITVNNKNYSGEIENGVARIPIDKLNEGNYSVFANYTGDKNFTNASVTQDNMVNVHKFACYDMNVIANDTKVDENTTIVVNLPSDATGNVSVYVNGTWAGNATISHGVAKVNVTKAVAGKYIVNATFTDGKYANKTVTTNYYVFKHDSPLDIDVESILVDDVAYINVTAPTDNVTIEINGKSYDAQSYAGGVARFVVSGLEYGNKTVVAKYGGSYKYLANSTTDKFTVDKLNTTINITVESIKYGEKLNITVNVTDGANGFITIRINNTRNITLPVDYGKVNWIVEGLAAGNYTVYADYSGDAKYNINGTNKPVEVTKATPVITIYETTVDSLNNASAIVIINTTATGTMNITVNKKNYTADIIDGIATFTVDILPVGTYNITATYAGDDNYTNASKLLENGLTVYKVASYDMNVTVNDTIVGENATIVVNVPLNATGKVVIYVNGTWAGNATIDKGVAKMNVTKDVAGKYIVNATLVDAKYANQTVTTAYWVSKVETPVNITVVNDNIRAGDTVEVIVSLPEEINGKAVTIEINGKKYTNTTDNVGNATFYIPSVTYGNKTVVAIYAGDNKYVANSTTANFTVTKRSSQVNVTVNETINVGQNATITVEVPSNATGYVIVNIGGNNYTINLTSGARSVVIAGLGNSTYRANVTYLGDDQYLSSINNTQLIKVNKVESSINLTVSDDGIIANGTSINITVETHVDATGKVNITISNETYNRTYTIYVNDGKGNLIIDELDIGKYNVTATYLGDDKYLTSTNKTEIEVYQSVRDLIIVANDTVPVNESEIITVILEGSHEGKVTVVLRNESGVVITRNVTITEHTSIFGVEVSIAQTTMPLLKSGDYEIYASYIETNAGKVILHEGTDDFNVYKLSSEISIKEIRNITVGENVTIELELEPGDAAGNISVFVNGVEYKLNESNLTITVPDLGAGEYNVTVFYYGNDMYNASDASAVFRVDKNDSPITINVINSKVGEIEQINVTLPNGTTGQVLLDIGDNHYYANITEGLAQFNITGLKSGEYKVNATYLGDYKYSSNSTNASITIEDVKVIPEPVVVDQGNGTLVIVVGDNATGNVTVKVGDKEFNATVINGTAVVTLENVTPGTHDIEVIYSGDDKYANATVNSTVTVPKYDSPINVTVGEAKEGQNVTVTVTVPANATGNVTVIIDGKEYSAAVDNGTATVTVENLTAGPKSIILEYSGDDNYTANYTVGNFTVEKAKVVPDINVVDLGNGTVVVVVGDNATGNVTVKVGDKEFNATVVNGTAVVDVGNLVPGNNTVEIIYSGDDTHTNATVPAVINGPKYDAPINVTVGEAKEGEPIEIIVEVPAGATGEVIVYVGGENHTGIIDSETGRAVVTVENVSAGNHTIAVEYPGDDNYASNYMISNMTVEKAKVTPDISVVDLGNNTVVVVVGDNATGNVTVKVGDKEYNATVVNGTAVVTLDNVTPGVHEVEVIYSGDDTHTNATTNADITAPKYETPVNITVGEAKEGEPVTVTVEVPENATGNVTVTIDGQKYTAEVINGTATVEVENLTAGPKSVIVEYDGDDNYAGNYTTSDFTVDKAKETSEVYIIDQGNGTVMVVVPNNATGNVTVKVGDKNYTAEVINGTATITLDDVTPGAHDVEVIYSGDDTHTNATVPAVVNGPKYDSPINVTVGEAKEGEPVTVTVEVPENATGNVTVTVDGKNYTAEIKDGKAVFEIDNLTSGPKSLIVEYPGDDNYTSDYAIHNFDVEKAKSTPDIKVIDQGNGTVVVVVGDNATGNVTVTVDGQNYTAEVIDGIAVVALDNATPGTHDIEVIYSGDDTHEGSTQDASIVVSDVDTPITVDVKNSYVGDSAVITVTVPENATGNITIEINGVSYTEEIVNGKATFTVDDLAAGDKTVSVIYKGDEYYTHNATTGQFKVSKRPCEITSTIEDLEVGENVTITVYGPGDATGQVLIDIDGVGYYVNLTDGVGTAQIPRIPSGIYNVNLTYLGDDKYLASTNVSQFNVNKVKSFVIPVAHDIYVGELETIRLTVPADATGNVTLIIDGEEYNFNLDTGLLSASYSQGNFYSVAVSGGNGEIVISGLPKGEYVVTARYNGDAKYLPAVNSTTFIVLNVESNMQVFDMHNGTVVVKVPCDATGNVTVRLGNETYTGTVENGTAIITLDNAEPGKHDIEVTYSGDDAYLPKTVNSTVEIPKRSTPISVEAHDIYVGESEFITVTLPDDATGNVTIEINAKKYTSAIENGKATFEVEGLAYGNKTVAVTYHGDNSYVENFTTGQFEVRKVPSDVSAVTTDIYVGDDETIIATVPRNATGRVAFDILGVRYYVEIENDTAIITLPDLPAGTYVGEIFYEGDEKYQTSNNTLSFTVSKYEPPISASGDEIKVHEDGTVVVKLPEDATGTVTVVVDGENYTAPLVNGQVIFSIPGLTVGEHHVAVYYSGDDKYLANSTVTEIVVKDTPSENKTDGHPEKVHEAVGLSTYATGNPIFILILIILVMGSAQLRRFKK